MNTSADVFFFKHRDAFFAQNWEIQTAAHLEHTLQKFSGGEVRLLCSLSRICLPNNTSTQRNSTLLKVRTGSRKRMRQSDNPPRGHTERNHPPVFYAVTRRIQQNTAGKPNVSESKKRQVFLHHFPSSLLYHFTIP